MSKSLRDIEAAKGKMFGYLKLLRLSGATDGFHKVVVCRCRCGNEITVRWQSVKNGNTKSCGCYRAEVNAEALRQRAKLRREEKRDGV